MARPASCPGLTFKEALPFGANRVHSHHLQDPEREGLLKHYVLAPYSLVCSVFKSQPRKEF